MSGWALAMGWVIVAAGAVTAAAMGEWFARRLPRGVKVPVHALSHRIRVSPRVVGAIWAGLVAVTGSATVHLGAAAVRIASEEPIDPAAGWFVTFLAVWIVGMNLLSEYVSAFHSAAPAAGDDRTLEFVRGHCRPDPTAACAHREVVEAYLRWAAEHRVAPASPAALAEALVAHGFRERVPDSAQSHWLGLRLDR